MSRTGRTRDRARFHLQPLSPRSQDRALHPPGRPAGVLGLLVLVLAASACGGSRAAVTYEQIGQRKQEIAMLWGQIRAWRQDAGLRGVEPPRRAILEMRGQPMAKATRVCPQRIEPHTPACLDTCSLADAICENADRICRVAGELAGDAWADDKCASAKASCKEARQACCRCWSEEPPPDESAADDATRNDGRLDGAAEGGGTVDDGAAGQPAESPAPASPAPESTGGPTDPTGNDGQPQAR